MRNLTLEVYTPDEKMPKSFETLLFCPYVGEGFCEGHYDGSKWLSANDEVVDPLYIYDTVAEWAYMP